MKLGFVSAILPDLSCQEVFQFARDTGFDCVEVMCWPPGKAERRYAGVTHIDVTQFDEAGKDSMRQCMADTGVEVSALGYYPNPLSADEDEAKVAVAHLKEVILAAEQLELYKVNTFVGRNPKLSVEENWPKFLKTWKPIVEFAEAHGVTIGIENCPMLFTDDEWPGGKNLAISPAIWQRMFEDIPSQAWGLNYDPSHLVWMQMDYLQPLFDFADRIVHVHAKDVRVDRDRLNRVGILATPLEFHHPKLPGLGEVQWGKFCSILGDLGYKGPMCVEVEDRAYEDSLHARRAALRQSHNFLRNFVVKR